MGAPSRSVAVATKTGLLPPRGRGRGACLPGANGRVDGGGIRARALTLALACAGCGDAAGRPRAPLEADLSGLDPQVVARIEPLRAEVRARPDDAATWGRLGTGYYANHVPTLAVACLVEATLLAPDEPRWWYLRARVEAELGDEGSSLASIERSVALRPEESAAHVHMGELLLDRGELDAAAEAFRRATEAEARNPGGWLGLARVALQRDRNDEAIGILLPLYEQRAGDPYLGGLLSTAYRQAGLPELAEQYVPESGGLELGVPSVWDREVADLRADTFLTRWHRAAALQTQGKHAEAIAMFEALCEEDPTNTSICVLLGNSYADTGAVAKAERAYIRALATEPENRSASLGLARVLGQARRFDEALAIVDEVLARTPDFGRAHFVRGSLARDSGDLEGALGSYVRSLELDERNPGTRVAVGLLQLELEQWDGARATFEDATRFESVAADAWIGLARALAELGRPGEAERALAEGVARHPRDGRRVEEARRAIAERRSAEAGR